MTTFKQETCRNLAFLLRLRQVRVRKTVLNVLVKQRADYKLPKYRYCIKRETVITLPSNEESNNINTITDNFGCGDS